MKKLLFTTLLAIGLAATAFATDESKISLTIRNNFQNEFRGVQNVIWNAKDDYVKASFNRDGVLTDAYYDLTGKRFALSYSVSVAELPGSAVESIFKDYPDGQITETIKFDNGEENAYYVSVQDGDKTIVLKVLDRSTVSVFKKIRKRGN